MPAASQGQLNMWFIEGILIFKDVAMSSWCDSNTKKGTVRLFSFALIMTLICVQPDAL